MISVAFGKGHSMIPSKMMELSSWKLDISVLECALSITVLELRKTWVRKPKKVA